jgi:hypothetical protein
MDINYTSKKIIEENKYYIYLLSNTKEIGFTSKECLLNLYPYLFNKFNDTVSILLEKIFMHCQISSLIKSAVVI